MDTAMLLYSRATPNSTDQTKLTDQPVSKITKSALIGVMWSMCGIAIAFVVARVAIRIHFFRRLSGDDYFCLLALVILIGNTFVVQYMIPPMYDILAVSNGVKAPPPDFLSNSSLYLKLQFANTILFWSVLWSVKGAFLAFFRKLTNQTKYPRTAWWAVTVITVLAYIGCIITYPVSCTSFVLGQCQTPYHVSHSLISLRYSTAVDIITDLLIIAIPLWLVFGLKMSRSQKIGLAGVLGLGAIIVVFSVIRIIVTNTTGKQPEISWLALWSCVESSVAVIVACLASFKVLLTAKRGTGNYGTPQYVAQSGGQYGNNSAMRPGAQKNARGNKRNSMIRMGNRDPLHSSAYDDSSEMQNLGSKNPVVSVVTTKDKEVWDDDSSSQKHLRDDDIRVQTSFTVEHEHYSPVGRAK